MVLDRTGPSHINHPSHTLVPSGRLVQNNKKLPPKRAIIELYVLSENVFLYSSYIPSACMCVPVANVTVDLGASGPHRRSEWHLTGPRGTNASALALNGQLLTATVLWREMNTPIKPHQMSGFKSGTLTSTSSSRFDIICGLGMQRISALRVN